MTSLFCRGVAASPSTAAAKSTSRRARFSPQLPSDLVAGCVLEEQDPPPPLPGYLASEELRNGQGRNPCYIIVHNVAKRHNGASPPSQPRGPGTKCGGQRKRPEAAQPAQWAR